MRRSTLFVLCCALAAGASLSAISCKQTGTSPDIGGARQPLSVDADSDNLLAGLSPVLAPGHFVYAHHFIDPDTQSPLPLEGIDFTISAAGPGELSVERGGKIATVDPHGKFLGSSDPMVSYPFVSAVHLPEASAARGATWAMEGQPYTSDELQAANQAQAYATSNVTFNYSLGAKSLGGDAVVYVLKRDVYSYVVPTDKTLAEAPLLEAAGLVAFSPGLREQVGTVYDYFVVRTSDQQAVKLGEAFLQYGRFVATPASVSDVFNGTYDSPAIALVSVLDPAASSLPSDMVQNVQDALGALPADVKMWFDDTLPDGAIAATHSPFVNECTCTDTSCGDTGGSGGGGSGGTGGSGGGDSGGTGGVGGVDTSTTAVAGFGGGDTGTTGGTGGVGGVDTSTTAVTGGFGGGAAGGPNEGAGGAAPGDGTGGIGPWTFSSF